jgi:predicted RNA binding protein YcfA (HicA-like mRNA interferase family)
MRIPRDLSGSQLVQALSILGYSVTRQTGSHVRLTTSECGEHHVTIPMHAAQEADPPPSPKKIYQTQAVPS